MSSAAESSRPPGRPRSTDADRAILNAAVELLSEAGFAGVSIEAVADRAGVGRPTVYRRHADREALVEAAVRDCFENSLQIPPSTPDPYADVVKLLENTVHMLKRTAIGPVFRAAIPHLPQHPRLGRLANDLGRERRVRLRAAMARAIAAGALPAPAHLDTSIDGILGAIYFRYFITQRRLDTAYVRTLLKGLV